MEIDEAILATYMDRFVGFGTYAADFWCIGMEQGGGKDLAELARRLDAWRALGLAEVVDFARYCELIGETRWHGPRARIQRTLNAMIRVILSAEQREVSVATVRAYQADLFARGDGNTLVTELFPLPCLSLKHWIYGEVGAIPFLRSRTAYMAHMRPTR